MEGEARVLGILAGGGSLPREVADAASASGWSVFIVALRGEADADFGQHPVTYVGWGEIGRMLRTFKAAAVADLVIVGHVRRPNLRRVRPDLGLLRHLPSVVEIVVSGGDDSVLRRVVRFFEKQGFRVAGTGDVAPQLLVGPGPIAGIEAVPRDRDDIRLGFEVVRRLGEFDLGQSVVVAGGRIEAIEGAEGTDAMLERVARLRATQVSATLGGVLVKRPKPGQELRVDMPTIGPATAVRAGNAGLAGIAVLSNAVIAARKSELVRAADEQSIFIEGVEDSAQHEDAPPARPAAEGTFVQLGKVTPSRRDVDDLIKATGVLARLAPYEVGGAVAVSRRHVLGVETGEGTEAFLDRIGRLRQWGLKSKHARAGVAILGLGNKVEAAVVTRAANAGLKGLVVVTRAMKKDGWPAAIVTANSLGVFIGALTEVGRGPT